MNSQMLVRRDTRAVEFVRKLAGLTKTERAIRKVNDKARYHPPDPADYGSTVGMPVEDDSGRVVGYACVGCWYCSPDVPSTTTREAQAILREAGEDY